MKTVYEVRVERKVYDDEGNFLASETMFSTESPRPERLLAFAPGQVEAALIDEAEGADVPAVNPPGHYRAADTFANERPDGWEAPGEPVPGHVAPAPAEAAADDKPKRTRRTKAQIAADKAAEEAANAAAVDGPPIAAGGMPTPESEAAAATLFSGGTLPAEPVPAEGGNGPAAAPAEGGAWNPFLTPAK